MNSIKKILLQISYDGSYFAGWQTQNNGIAIQSLIEEKLSVFLKQKVNIYGSGRTDSGVHAKCQMAHFETSCDIDLKTIIYRLNCLLPKSIRVMDAWFTDPSFHARFSVIKKTYRYLVYNHAVMNPFLNSTHHYIPYELDLDLMRQAANKLIGFHDFKAFAAKNNQGTASHDSTRNLEVFQIKKEGNIIIFELTAKGFLYKMVRNLVGCCLEIGAKKKGLDVIDQAFSTGQRFLVGATAPSHGLILYDVVYDSNLLTKKEALYPSDLQNLYSHQHHLTDACEYETL